MARVLVIDDDREIRDLLVEVLTTEAYDVSSAPDGLVGLKEARAHRPDLILLDLMMPVMDGWTFLATQLEDPVIADIPVVVLSAARNVQATGAARCLSKPCDLDELLETVERHRLRGDHDRVSP